MAYRVPRGLLVTQWRAPRAKASTLLPTLRRPLRLHLQHPFLALRVRCGPPFPETDSHAMCPFGLGPPEVEVLLVPRDARKRGEEVEEVISARLLLLRLVRQAVSLASFSLGLRGELGCKATVGTADSVFRAKGSGTRHPTSVGQGITSPSSGAAPTSSISKELDQACGNS